MRRVTKAQAEAIVKDLLAKAHELRRQEFAGESEESLDRSVRQYRGRVARLSWRSAQKWCRWTDDGPVLTPDYTRLYYRKGKTEVLALEYPPQVRLLKFKGSLVSRNDSEERLNTSQSERLHHFSLALPYTVFLFRFVEGVFNTVLCAFNDRPLKRLDERPLRPYLSNIDNTLTVCLGVGLDRDRLEHGNVTQQAAFVLSHFWHTAYSDEWSYNYWHSKQHFAETDQRLATLDAWQASSIDNPLFVVEDVDWLRCGEENFGDFIVRLMEEDPTNLEFSEEMYQDLVSGFLTEVSKNFSDNLETVEQRVAAHAEVLADHLLEALDQ